VTVLIVGDTVRTPELRHEVPLGVPDPFVYAEIDGLRIVVIGAMEAARVAGLGAGLEVVAGRCMGETHGELGLGPGPGN